MLYPALLAHVQPTRYAARTKAMRIDSHLHVWASEAESGRFPYTVLSDIGDFLCKWTRGLLLFEGTLTTLWT